MRWLFVIVGLAGCGRFGFDSRGGEDDPFQDAATFVPPVFLDAPELAASDAPATCTTFASRHFDPCALPSPMGALMLTVPGTYTYNTNNGELRAPGGALIPHASLLIGTGRVISVDSLTLGAQSTLRGRGSRPLLVASFSTIQVDGTLDVSSQASEPGAGADPAECTAHPAAAGRNDNSGGSGGGGGGYAGTGGRGGDGENIGGGSGGAAVPVPLLLGGCKGGIGGRGDGTNIGTPGSGGGAVQLTARTSVVVNGSIHAGGGGGVGGDNDGAGGGGGSGGMIGVEAPMISITAGAIVAANGGGGGGGSDAEQNGGDGESGTLGTTRAQGGFGGDSGDGGPGGDGSDLGNPAGTTGGHSLAHAGGGGGGGAGFIVLVGNVTMMSQAISPLPMTL